ncbi:MAG: hypothetical protein CVU21_05590 [Betaproteobacteria bacterium HGW-Betaproteobacteria-15]|nr:MAG: hypothetical protein CVU21_05590 [Betaproteobacteria bacterium HGW-Betaproteobacteria-15]
MRPIAAKPPMPVPAMATTPPHRPRLWQRAIACVLMLTIQVSSFAQVTGPLLRGFNNAVGSGYRADGTLVLGGQVVHGGGPGVHQGLHDILNPTLWSTAAVALSNTTDPSFVQGTLQEMQDATAVYPEEGAQALSRLYLTTHNPYSLGCPEADAAEMLANPDGNLARYQASLDQALLLQDGWRATVPGAGGSGQSYLGRTHDSTTEAIFNRGFDSYPDKPVFQAAQDPAGGATAFLALQGAQAMRHLQHLQTQHAQVLGGTVFFSQQTIQMPGPGGSSSGGVGGFGNHNNEQAWADFDAALGSGFAQSEAGWGATSGFTLGYLDPNAQGHTFNIHSDPHFRNLHQQQHDATMFGSEGQGNTNALLGEALRQGAVQHQLGQQAVANLDLSQFKDDQALFFQGFDLFGVGNLTDRAEQELLERLSTGQITPGHPDYERARALAEERFKLGYAQMVEYERPQAFNEFGARWQAQSQNLTGVSDAELFNQGFDLYDRKADPRQEQLLRDLQSGQLKPGMAGYEEARALAEARYRVALEQALTPPKNDPWKQIVAIVVAAVVVYFTAGAASGWAASAIPGATTTVASTSMVGGVAVTTTSTVIATSTVAGAAATAIGSAVGAYAGAVVSAGIQTGSLSQALKAGEGTLKGGVAGILVNMALTGVGLDAGAISGGLGVSKQSGESIYSGLAGALTNTAAYGGDLGKNLLNGAINTGVDIVSQQAASWIGANTDVGSFEKYAAHALLGCGAGMAKSGSGDGCVPAATGAVIGHLSADSVKVALSNGEDPGVLANMFNAVPGKTLNDNVAFISGLIGGGAAALVGDDSQIQGNFALGQGAAENAVKNNYLKFDEAKKLNGLKEQELIGQCQSDCKTEIARLEAVDRQRNEQLAQCQGSSASSCQQVFQEVRLSAAEYVRKDGTWTAPEMLVVQERHETLVLARDTTDGKLQGAAQGYWEALRDAAIGLKDLGQTLYAAANGDQQAQEKVKQGAGAAADYVSEPENWPYLLGAMTPQDRERLAQAYEAGNGTEIGRLMGQQVADIPIGGGPIGSIKKIDGVVGANGGVSTVVGNLEPGNPLSTSIPRTGDRILINQGQLPTCGPTSCGMVLNSVGIEVDIGTVISQSRVTSVGTTMPRLVQVLNDNGLPAQRVLGATVEDIAAATANGDPAIVRMTLDRGGHAVVVDGVTIRNGQQVVAIRDPAGGRQYFTPIEEFRASFSGEAAVTKRSK